MKNIFKQRLAKILLLLLFCSSVAFTQSYYSFINYKGKIRQVQTNIICFVVKEGYYNDELIEKLKDSLYSHTYSYIGAIPTTTDGSYFVMLYINDDPMNINILDHYLKFEKEEYVEEIVPYMPDMILVPNGTECDIKGQIFQNDKPFTNYIINLIDNQSSIINIYNSITDENGNYIFSTLRRDRSYTLFFRIGDIRYDTTFVLDGDKTLDFNIDAVLVNINETEEIPTTYSLSQNYPNPFNPTTIIQYSIPKDEFVKLTVYDITGKVVKELVNSHKAAGRYSVEFNASSYSSGIYYYKLEAGQYNSTQKMMLVK